MFSNQLGHQKCGDRSDHKRHHDQPERMRQWIAVAPLALGKRGEKLRDPFAKINWQAKNGAELNHNRIHFPVAARQANVEQRLRNSQVRRRADRQKFRQPLDNSQQQGQYVIVQFFSPGCLPASRASAGRILRIS